jgi:FK506-binding protein 3
MPIPEKKWTLEEIKSDAVTKKDVIEYIQSLATLDYNLKIIIIIL